MTDWADESAREWLRGQPTRLEDGGKQVASLAALLREVDERLRQEEAAAVKECCLLRKSERENVLAKVRRVVEQAASDVRLACISTTESDAVGALRGALLSRLDKL